jgi:hypothetical protein
MEEGRLVISLEDTEAYFHQLGGMVHRLSAHFVLNVDEMGHQELADREGNTCDRPSELTGGEVPLTVPRSDTRITRMYL